MTLTTIMKQQEAILKKEISALQRKIKTMPEGLFVCYKYKNNTKWYQELKNSSGKVTRKYIPKAEKALAKKLAQKTYYTKLLSAKKLQYKNVQRYLEHDKAPSAYKLLDEAAKMDDLLDEIVYKRAWEKAEYPRNEDHKEKLLFKTKKGDMVRSKTEAYIADTLFELSIPYRYECPIVFDGITLHPDFTILHPTKGITYIWEHLGLMDKPSYVQNSLGKIPLYISQGYMPGYNLLFSYESNKYPIDYALIREMVQFYFCE